MAEMARQPDQVENVRQVIRDLTGKPTALTVRLLTGAESAATSVRSNVETSRTKANEEKQRREREAREHPMTRLVLETFGAQIKEIKTDV